MVPQIGVGNLFQLMSKEDFFHILLNSENTCLGRSEKMRNIFKIIDHIVLSKTKEISTHASRQIIVISPSLEDNIFNV